jgi:hypothetical membrane protein
MAPLERVPWWGITSAALAPVFLIGGWTLAQSTVPGFDPVRQTISDLAAADEPNRWVMTLALVLTGLAHIVTACGLRPADVTGRAVLFLGGVATLLVAWIPNNLSGRNVVGHMIVAYMAFATLSLWPAVIARDRPDAPLVLRRRFGQALTLVLLALVAFTIADIVTGGATLGLRERLLSGAQAFAPLVVVLGTLQRQPVAIRSPA